MLVFCMDWFYIEVKLYLENDKIPSFMEPINGIGLPEQHPAILLALLVRKSDKKKMKPKP